ncbi:MAG: hypothetical protein M3277_10815 [Actinomycetota bacterium]|nr:hypothetical protein [Actinomycetota bacterium]
MLRRTGSLIVLLAVIALLAFTVAPAFGHHKDGHENGGGSQASNHDDDDLEGDNQHPSGKDRETNDGPTDDIQGGTQTSNPDNDGHGPERNSCEDTSEDRVGGCADKPGGTGGVDDADQDWNNGCGNDDDFEDDNEGWCGGKPKPTPSPTPAAQVEGVVEEVEKDDKDDKDDVLGSVISRGQPGGSVLGGRVAAAPSARAAAEVAGAVLPFTGLGVVPVLLVGLGLVATGWLVVRKDA